MAEGITDQKEQSLLDELAHSETVRKLIECPVCLELPLPPIYVCNKGHIVCNNCQARTYSCPLCREHYSTTRGFVAEGIIEKCILRCKNSDQGCPLSMRGSELVDHLEICDYRPVKCVDCAGKLINFDEYEDHLLKHHRINGINQNRAYVIYSMNLAHQIAFGEKCCWPQYFLKTFDNVTFLLRLYATHWFVCAWVSLLGPKSECAKYEALLEFHPTNDDSVVHTWQGPVNHFRADPAKEVFLQGRGLITPMETLMQMAPVTNDHAEWLYNIEILQAEKSDSEEACQEEQIDDSVEGTTTTDSQVEEKVDDSAEVSTCPVDATTDQSAVTLQTQQADVNSKPTRLPKSPARIVIEAPQQQQQQLPVQPSLNFRTPRRTTLGSANTAALTPRPATLSPSTTVLAQAATVTSIVPTPSSLMENVRNSSTASQSSPFSMQSYGNVNASSTTQSPVTVSTVRPSARLINSIRRATPFSFLNRNFGISEDDWNFTSESDDDDE